MEEIDDGAEFDPGPKPNPKRPPSETERQKEIANGVPTCLTETCGKKREWKGLCRSCYGQAKHLIENDQTTWDELEEMGLCVQDDKPFRNAFRKKKAELFRQKEVSKIPPWQPDPTE